MYFLFKTKLHLGWREDTIY